MKKFAVYDNGRPAKYPEIKVHKSWTNNKFNTFEEALAYTLNWLGPYGKGIVLKLSHIITAGMAIRLSSER